MADPKIKIKDGRAYISGGSLGDLVKGAIAAADAGGCVEIQLNDGKILGEKEIRYLAKKWGYTQANKTQ